MLPVVLCECEKTNNCILKKLNTNNQAEIYKIFKNIQPQTQN